MKRSTHTGISRVYSYGGPSWTHRVLDPETLRQFELAHEMRNRCVEIERQYDESRTEIMGGHDYVNHAMELVEKAREECLKVTESIKRQHQRERTTTTSIHLKADLAVARAALKDARVTLKEAKAVAKTDLTPRLTELAETKKKALTGLYAEFGLRGMSWATRSDILAKHEVSAKQVMALRKQGKPAQHSWHSYRDSTTLTMQVQKDGKGQRRAIAKFLPARPVTEWFEGYRPKKATRLVEGFHSLVQLQLGRDTVMKTHTIELPSVIHRPIPEGAEITWVRLTRTYVGATPRYRLQFTLNLPQPAVKAEGQIIAIKFGWKRVASGTKRVAKVRMLHPEKLTQVPEGLIRFTVPVPGGFDVIFPPEWQYVFDRCDGLQSDRSKGLDEVRAKVVAALQASLQLAVDLELEASNVDRWRSPGRFALLAQRWPKDHPLHTELESWRRWDKKLWQEISHTRDKLLAHRKDTWRKVALWICQNARSIVLDQINIAKMKEAPVVGQEDTPQERGSRHSIQLAAPGELRLLISHCAEREGVEVVEPEEEGEEDGS